MDSSSVMASGPTGMPAWREQFSISAGLMPSATMPMASSTKAPMKRLVKKPRASFTTMGVFFSWATKSSARASVSSLVARPRITSTSGMRSAGEKKCRPM